jgi:hypothetical protein
MEERSLAICSDHFVDTFQTGNFELEMAPENTFPPVLVKTEGSFHVFYPFLKVKVSFEQHKPLEKEVFCGFGQQNSKELTSSFSFSAPKLD